MGNKKIVLRELIGNQRGFQAKWNWNRILMRKKYFFDDEELLKALWPNG